MFEIAFMQIGTLLQDHHLEASRGKFLGHNGSRTTAADDQEIDCRFLSVADHHFWSFRYSAS